MEPSAVPRQPGTPAELSIAFSPQAVSTGQRGLLPGVAEESDLVKVGDVVLGEWRAGGEGAGGGGAAAAEAE